MKMRLVAVLLPMLFAGAAMAATPQQEKMKACNAEAATKALKGDGKIWETIYKVPQKLYHEKNGEAAPRNR